MSVWFDPGITWRHGAELAVNRPQTLAALCAAAHARAGDAVVIVDGELRLTWSDLLQRSGQLAAQWKERITVGDRIAMILPNGVAHLLVELAAWRLGAIAVPLFQGGKSNAARDQLATRLRLVAPVLVVVADPTAIPETLPVVTLDAVLTVRTSTEAPAWYPAHADTPCLILFTSGSTGEPHGVVLSHDNLCSQQAAFAELWPEIGPGDRLAAHLPWHHSFGSLAERLWALCRGATLTIVPGDGRDQPRLLAAIQAVRPTVVMTVPKLHGVLTRAGVLDTRVLRWVFTAGAALGAEASAWYVDHGVPIYEGWGLTETSPSATITPPGRPRHAGVVGEPIPGVAVGVDGDGHLHIAGPGVMLGYLGQPRLSQPCLDSGDCGAWTDHGLRLDGRADQVLKLSNGEKVAAAAIAGRLEDQPGIRHAVVVAEGDGLIALLAGTAAALPMAVRHVNAAEPVGFRRIQRAYAVQVDVAEAGLLTPAHKLARGAWLAAFARWQAGSAPGWFAAVPHTEDSP